MCAAAVVVFIFAWGAASLIDSRQEAGASVAVPPPAADGTAMPSATAVENDAAVEASPPTRLAIEDAGIDVEVLPLLPSEEALAEQAIVPPLTEDGYWLASYGQPGRGSTNTTYLTGHSWEGSESPFNRLSTHAEVGNTITLDTEAGSLDYVVESITTHNKETLKDSDIWSIVPNRLVIISCYTEDLWGKNVIVTAAPKP